MLVHQLPPRPSNVRVHVWRRLQQVGAVALRNSLYVLPNTPEAREDFDWVRTEIAGRGGQVSILAAQAVDGYTDDELEASFRAARTADYEALIRDVRALGKRLGSKTRRLSRVAIQREVGKVRERLRALRARDFFGARRSADAQAAVDGLERALQTSPPIQSPGGHLDARSFRRRVWVTRPRPGIDRMASAWLVRRFIAPDARFAFAAAPARDQIPFDMADVEFGHHGSECTYETLLRRFGIADPAATRIAQLVHDLDLKESRYGVPEAPTIGRLVDGLRRVGPDDHAVLENGMAMIGALYRSFADDSDKRLSRRPRTRPARKRGARSKAV